MTTRYRPLLLAVVLGLAALDAGGAVAVKPPDPYQILLRSRRRFVPKPDVQRHLRSGDPRGVLQFDAIPSVDRHAELQAAGITLHDYLPHLAYTATIDPTLTPADLAALGVRAWFALKRNDRLEVNLHKGKVGAWAQPAPPAFDVVILRYPDFPEAEAVAAVSALGGTVLGSLEPFRQLTARMTRKSIRDLAKQSWVLWIEPVDPPAELDNDDSRQSINVDPVQMAPYNLSGGNVRVAIFDGGDVDEHPDLLDRFVNSDPMPLSEHATHVAGTLAGNGTLSAGLFRGMAPQALLFVWHLGNYLPKALISVTTEGTVISQNSWGLTVSNLNNSCHLLGDYGSLPMGVDQLVRVNNLATTFSAGNTRYSICAPITYGTIGVPGSSKNVVTVGAINKVPPGQMTAFSGWGPTDDGRLKPDVVAVGFTVESTCLNSTYCFSTGTSMAAPAVSGTAALLMEYYRQLNGNLDPPPALVKAILLNTTVDLGTAGPDFQYGYGKLDARLAADTVGDGRYVHDDVAPAQHKRFYFDAVGPPSCVFRLLLAYTDREGAPTNTPALVSDLDLKIVDPDGNVFLPLTLDPNNPANAAVPAVNDRDNVEQIVVQGPTPGTWTARVSGTTVPFGAQDFALTWQSIETVTGDACSFDAACPDPNDPCVSYVSQNPATCAAISFTCPPGDDKFTGNAPCGCGCIANCP